MHWAWVPMQSNWFIKTNERANKVLNLLDGKRIDSLQLFFCILRKKHRFIEYVCKKLIFHGNRQSSNTSSTKISQNFIAKQKLQKNMKKLNANATSTKF